LYTQYYLFKEQIRKRCSDTFISGFDEWTFVSRILGKNDWLTPLYGSCEEGMWLTPLYGSCEEGMWLTLLYGSCEEGMWLTVL